MSNWRFIVTKPDGNGSESLITTELPAESVSITVSLSAPCDIQFTLPIHFRELMGSDGTPVFQTWGTCIYAERDGRILSGAIVDEIDATGSKLNVSAIGFTGYLEDMPYMGEYAAYDADPLNLARLIWAHVQAQPGGNLALSVSGLRSNRRIGTKGHAAFRGRPEIKDVAGNVVTKAIPPRPEIKDEPFLLSWYQTTNLLDDFNKLSKVTPFDYAERHFWSGDIIAHHLDLGHPVLGRRREDLRFVLGENLRVAPKIYQSGDDYASEVMLLGAGEGSKQVKSVSNRADSNRLRRVSVLSDPGIPTASLAKAMTDNELRYRTGMPSVADMTVLDHPNAPFGTFDVGDSIFVQASNSWFADTDMWVRITSITYTPGEGETAKLTVVKEGE